MKKQIHVFYKSTSLVLAICILFASCFTFQGCNGYEEDYSVLKESNQIPKILGNSKLSETDDLIVNLKNTIMTGEKNRGELKSAHIDNIESQFGALDWSENQLVTYDNGQEGIYVPIIKDEKVAAFLLSKPSKNKYKSIIIEVLPENNEGDELFSGKINFYTVNGGIVSSYLFCEGEYVPPVENTSGQIIRLKSGYVEGDCSLSCLSGCISHVLGLDPLYSFACGLSCGSFATVFGAFMCIACIGGPALYCMDQCCDVF
jgi:hypothetical protein